MSGVALNWIITKGAIPIPGASSVEQVHTLFLLFFLLYFSHCTGRGHFNARASSVEQVHFSSLHFTFKNIYIYMYIYYIYYYIFFCYIFLLVPGVGISMPGRHCRVRHRTRTCPKPYNLNPTKCPNP